MHYNIKGTGVDITDEIRAYVEKRLNTLDKYTNDAARVDLELEFLKGEAKMYRTEMMLHVPGLPPLRAEATGSVLHESVDIAVGEMTRELSQGKKKRLHIFRRSAVRVKEVLRGWRDKF